VPAGEMGVSGIVRGGGGGERRSLASVAVGDVLGAGGGKRNFKCWPSAEFLSYPPSERLLATLGTNRARVIAG